MKLFITTVEKSLEHGMGEGFAEVKALLFEAIELATAGVEEK